MPHIPLWFLLGVLLPWLLVQLPALGLVAVALFLLRRCWPPLPVLLLFAGCAWAGWQANDGLERQWPCRDDRVELALQGWVATPPQPRGRRLDFEFKLGQAVPPLRIGDRIQLSWYEPQRALLTGEPLSLQLRLRCPSGLRNPAGYDRELALLRQGVRASGTLTEAPQPWQGETPTAALAVQRLRAQVAAGIERAIGVGDSSAVLQGLAVGLRASLADELWQAFANTGLAHLIAISGSHVTAFAVWVMLLLRGLWRLLPPLPGNRRIALEGAAVIAATVAYSVLAGASIPTLRTLTTVSLLVLLRVYRRSLPLPHVLLLAAALLALFEPLALASAGFWLSFVATFALLLLLVGQGGWRLKLRQFAAAQALVLLALVPVLLLSFGRVSLVAPLANGVALPLFTVVLLPLTLLATALELAGATPAPVLWRFLAGLLDPLWPALVALGRHALATWIAPLPGFIALAVASVGIGIGLLLPMAGLRLAMTAVLLALLLAQAPRPLPGSYQLTVLDVGQGLSVVVQTARHVLVFDAGPSWQGGGSAGASVVGPYLESRGLRSIDRLVLSHDDSDHAGGAADLLERFAVAGVLTPSRPGAAAASGACRSGQRWHWDEVEFRVLHPPAAADWSDNDMSCALMVEGGGVRSLLLADPEWLAEQVLLRQDLQADVVLVPHHGSRSSSSPELVTRVAARLAIVSTGFGNRWGLPADEVVARWRSQGTTVLQTAADGAIQLRLGPGCGICSVRPERRERPRWWARERAARGPAGTV